MGLRNHLGTVSPGNAVMVGHDQLLADAFNFHLAFALADAQSLNGHQFAVARRLGDVTRGGQRLAVELTYDLTALINPAGIGDEHRLMDDGSRVLSPWMTFSIVCKASPACCRREPVRWGTAARNVADIVQVYNGVTNPRM